MLGEQVDGLIAETVLDHFRGQVRPLLRLRACCSGWRTFARPRLVEDCEKLLRSEDSNDRIYAVTLLAAARVCEDRGAPAAALAKAAEAAEAAACQVSMRLADGDPDVRRVAVRTFAHLSRPGDRDACDKVSGLLQDRVWPVRWAAVDAIAELATDSCQSAGAVALCARLQDRDWPIRRAAAGALAKVSPRGDQAVVAAVSMLLQDCNEMVRCGAVDALALLASRGHTDIVHSIAAIAEDSDARVRCATMRAIQALAEPGDLRALAAAKARTHDEDDRVRQVAEDTVKLISTY
eukprot:gnl/TRDRNA2_/TRDRNA2_28401_c0_seq1.p1 gnl/TRDRNA2_/TRDRNA2_28401_c0~~gnl/TRDRNA2_/TRDRNA2_28401_c0_seq1.p1  ORF type:complete len:293 (-),score=44.19 gnl/TRDRNA2_/TRDRNA2_28401_c0_seq1:54-932(-)